MKIIAIMAALAALPLTAQDTPAEPSAPVACSCPQQQADAGQKCPQAAMAAAFGFQRGYHMGFEAGFAEAIHIIQKGGCPGGCKGGKHGRGEKPMPGNAMRPAPQPAAPQATPAPAPAAE